MGLINTNNPDIVLDDQSGDYINKSTGDTVPLEKLPKGLDIVKPSSGILSNINDFVSQHGFGAGIGPGNPELAEAMPMGSPQQIKETIKQSAHLLPMVGAALAPEALPFLGVSSAPVWGSAVAMGTGAGAGKMAENKITGEENLYKDVPSTALATTAGGFIAPMLSNALKGALNKGTELMNTEKIAPYIATSARNAVNEANYGTSEPDVIEALKGFKNIVSKPMNNIVEDALESAEQIGGKISDGTMNVLEKVKLMRPEQFVKTPIDSLIKSTGKADNAVWDMLRQYQDELRQVVGEAGHKMGVKAEEIGKSLVNDKLSNALGKILAQQGTMDYGVPAVKATGKYAWETAKEGAKELKDKFDKK